ncbi:hypothetical protein [Wenyingzhuangia sp. IMCC45574]
MKRKLYTSVWLISILFFNPFYGQKKIKLYTGSWNTSEINKETKIANRLSTPHLFKISSVTLNQIDANFHLIVDGKLEKVNLQEEGQIFVSAKDLSIKQVAKGSIQRGQWEVVGKLDSSKSEIKWQFEKLPKNNKIVVAIFNEPKDFVLHFNNAINCSSSKMKIYVDGNMIKNSQGKTLNYIRGSSVLGVGKRVEIELEGNCTQNYVFSGTLKIK